MPLVLENYRLQTELWPKAGKHILAQFDQETITVYQAYKPAIGLFAAKNQRFGGEFSLSRMSWIKPNFLWMMFRSNWGTSPGQEVTLAVSLKRSAFQQILQAAVHSSFQPDIYTSTEDWKAKMAASEVRLQWDPDHAPHGDRLERRAVQLGMSGSALEKYSHEWMVRIEDISGFVAEQREVLATQGPDKLMLPRERVYEVLDATLAERLQLSFAPDAKNQHNALL